MFMGVGNSTKKPQAQKALLSPWSVVGPFEEVTLGRGPGRPLCHRNLSLVSLLLGVPEPPQLLPQLQARLTLSSEGLPVQSLRSSGLNSKSGGHWQV